MMGIRDFAVVISLAWTLAIAGPAAAQSRTETPIDIERITIVHPACAEGCATYRLEVAPDGVVRYEGLGFVKVFGRRTWVIPEQQATQLFRAAGETELVPSPENSAHVLTAKGQCRAGEVSPANITLRAAGSSGFPAEACFSPKVQALVDAVELATGVSVYAKGEDVGSQEAIRAVLDSQVEAWNRGDLQGYMRGYWMSPELTFFSGASETSGWTKTLERYRKAYKSEGRQMGKLSFDNVRIEMLSPDAAFVRGQWKLEMTNGQEPHGVYTLVMRRMPDGWRIIHDHSSGN